MARNFIYHGSKRAVSEVRTHGETLDNAIILANNFKSVYNAHIADTSDHTSGADATNGIAAADASTLATLITLVTEALTDYDAHDDDAELGSSWAFHAAQEAADHSPAATTAPTTLALCWTRLKDLTLKYQAHDEDSTAHGVGSAHTSLIAVAEEISFGKSDQALVAINEQTALTITLTDAYDGAEILIRIDSPSVDDTLVLNVGSTACVALASTAFVAGDLNYARVRVMDAINEVAVVEFLVS